MRRLIFRRARRFVIHLPVIRWQVPPLIEIATVTTAGAWFSWLVGYYSGVRTGETPSVYGYWCLGGGGLATLWGALYSVARRVVQQAEDMPELMEDAPETPSTVNEADGWNMFRQENPGFSRSDYRQIQMWMATFERQFGIRFSKLRGVANYLLNGRNFVYAEVTPSQVMLSRSEWNTLHPALIKSGWVTVKGKSISGLTDHGRQMLKCISKGTPPQLKAYAEGDTQPIRTHAHRAQG